MEYIGFTKTHFESGYELTNKPEMDLLPAFGLSEKDSMIKIIQLKTLPSDNFMVTLMEWSNPKTQSTPTDLLNSITISVKNVTSELLRLKNYGLKTESPSVHNYPIYGKVIVGKVYINNTIIELCEFVGVYPTNEITEHFNDNIDNDNESEFIKDYEDDTFEDDSSLSSPSLTSGSLTD